MKSIKIILLTTVLFCNIKSTIANSCENNILILEQITLAKQVYNRMVVSTRIVTFTNKFIAAKATERSEVPDNIWE